MVDSDERKTEVKKEVTIPYRDSIIITLGIFNSSLTKNQFYNIYSKVYSRLHSSKFVSFQLPSKSLFFAMIKKLISKGIIKQYYSNNNYILDLSNYGRAAYEVIIEKIRMLQYYDKIKNIYQLYSKYSAY